MSYLEINQEDGKPIELYYDDQGSGHPVLLVHAWPLTSKCWEKQVEALLHAGYRVITYDRRGFGRSSKPAFGYDYGSLASDLYHLIGHLDPHKLTLVGFSMGGGEVARYLNDYGSKRVSQAVFIASVPPEILRSPTNPNGIDGNTLDEMQRSITTDKEAFLRNHLKNFYNQDIWKGDKADDQFVNENWQDAINASPETLNGCIQAWRTNLSREFSNIDTPTLIVHGGADRLLPASTGTVLHEFIKESHLVVMEDGSHGLNWTHAEQLNTKILEFIKLQ